MPDRQLDFQIELLEQYKVYLADLGNLGSRYTSLNTYYITLATGLLGLIAFKEKKFSEIDLSTLFIICLSGVALCVIWYITIQYFTILFKAKFRTLGRLEDFLAFPCFSEEWKFLCLKNAKRWTRIERFIPVTLATLFASIFMFRFYQ